MRTVTMFLQNYKKWEFVPSCANEFKYELVKVSKFIAVEFV